MSMTQGSAEELLALAAVAAVAGQLVRCWQRGRVPALRSLMAGLLLSAAAGASAAYLALYVSALPLTLVGAGLLGFAVGAVWGPSGLWRLVGWLGPPSPTRSRGRRPSRAQRSATPQLLSPQPPPLAIPLQKF